MGQAGSGSVGLVLSGGGTRALLYHLGVLKWCAERGLLDNISHISSISGGSWCVGCVLGHSGGQWPASESFLQEVLPNVRATLTKRSMLLDLVFELLRAPWLIGSRYIYFVRMFRRRWRLTSTLDELPDVPEFHINATTFETGKRWSFSRARMGDYVFGYANLPRVEVAMAVAASSGFPLFVGSVPLEARRFAWQDGPFSKGRGEKVRQAHPVVHLWDGGVYENTGLEPLFKGDQLRNGVNFLVVADASEPLALAKRSWWFTRALRLLLISMDQVRSLRARQVVRAFERDRNGFYAKIGKSPDQHLADLGLGVAPWFANSKTARECEELAKFTIYPTRIAETDFDALVAHGWQTCEAIYGALYELGAADTARSVTDPVGAAALE